MLLLSERTGASDVGRVHRGASDARHLVVNTNSRADHALGSWLIQKVNMENIQPLSRASDFLIPQSCLRNVDLARPEGVHCPVQQALSNNLQRISLPWQRVPSSTEMSFHCLPRVLHSNDDCCK